MSYSLRDVSIVMGVVSMVLVFAIASFWYLGIKIRMDIRRKFYSNEEEDEVEEDDSQKTPKSAEKEKDKSDGSSPLKEVDLKKAN